MLRHDQCWPATTEDDHKLETAIKHGGEFSIVLEKIVIQDPTDPRHDRVMCDADKANTEMIWLDMDCEIVYTN